MIQISPLSTHDEIALKFIARIYTESFPPNERREFCNVVRLLEKKNDFSILLISSEHTPIGFISYWEWDDFIYIEHFAVDSHYRGAGYGAAAITTFLERMHKPVVLEVEMPSDSISQRRIGFYERVGFSLCTLPYIQPPYAPDKKPLDLYLMSYGEIDLNRNFNSVASQIHQEVYGVSNKNLSQTVNAPFK